jgi:hypothetical protein
LSRARYIDTWLKKRTTNNFEKLDRKNDSYGIRYLKSDLESLICESRRRYIDRYKYEHIHTETERMMDKKTDNG